MAQILKPDVTSGQLAGLMGRSLGSGISGLIGNKLKQMQTAQGLEGAGIDPQKASVLAGLSPDLQKVIIPQEMKAAQREKELGLLNKMYPAGESLDDPKSPDSAAKKASMEIFAGGGNLVQSIAAGQQAKANVEKLKQRGEEQVETRKFKEKQLALNETRTYRYDVDKAAKTAKTDLISLKTQEDLVKSGKLIGPRALLFLDKVSDMMGLNELQRTALKNDESVVFEKLSIPFFRSLKETFGARPTKFDAQQIAKGFPSLYQSDKGKLIINSFMTMEKKTSIETQRLKNAIVKENGGVPPLDLSAQVEEKLETYRNAQYIEFRKKMDEQLVSEGPKNDLAKKLGAGATVTGENGVFFVSDGSKWSVLK